MAINKLYKMKKNILKNNSQAIFQYISGTLS